MVIVKSKKRMPDEDASNHHKFGIIITARNEEKVIGQLLDSIYSQNYPEELMSVYVVADNCVDNTAEIAQSKGARVFERNDLTKIGKGYALHFLFDKILKDDNCDAYIVFDADNLVSPNFLTEINKTYSKGYRIVLGYRNSKNYATNWISAGYSLWFLRDSEYLNHPRMRMSTSCLIAGTGFLICRTILDESAGWNYFSLTEDVEFTANMIIKGEKMGYCSDAVFYDEQPVDFRQSWTQRVRWTRGYYQVALKHGGELVKGALIKRNFACFDMLMSIFPMFVIIFAYFACTLTGVFSILHLVLFLAFVYLVLFILGLLPTITEWKNIDATASQKILYALTFPTFVFTFIPIAGVALFNRSEWVPVKHDVGKKIEDMKNFI